MERVWRGVFSFGENWTRPRLPTCSALARWLSRGPDAVAHGYVRYDLLAHHTPDPPLMKIKPSAFTSEFISSHLLGTLPCPSLHWRKPYHG
ncbi:hypothetical protein IQ07DRAFT_185078 [Pyrenochaeta sp. DS3sAY3a]|nr:hypothetical protein IQ07DRAFT_185078 [Pyrenochaeta sp. DS3sAY3a]